MNVAASISPLELFEAIAREKLRVEFQPIVSLGTGSFVRFEALCRWTHPKLGEVAPAVFIPMAEAAGSITPLTLVVARRIGEMLRRMRPTYPDMHVSMNVALPTLQWDGFFATIEKILGDCGCSLASFGIEVTETTLMRDYDKLAATLTRFRDGGVRVDMDDFGTGYSSLSRLAALDVDAVKIDSRFVMGTLGDSRREAVVEATVALAHRLGLEIVAEGVENVETWDYLQALGCDSAQGFYIARPMPERDVAQWMGSGQAAFARRSRIEGGILGSGRVQVLIAEDEPALLEMMRSVLAASGFEVITARNGVEALDLLDQTRPAVVLVDAHLPVVDGLRVLTTIKERGLGAATVLTSPGPTAARWAKEHGASTYLAKPFGADGLLEVVRAYAKLEPIRGAQLHQVESGEAAE